MPDPDREIPSKSPEPPEGGGEHREPPKEEPQRQASPQRDVIEESERAVQQQSLTEAADKKVKELAELFPESFKTEAQKQAAKEVLLNQQARKGEAPRRLERIEKSYLQYLTPEEIEVILNADDPEKSWAVIDELTSKIYSHSDLNPGTPFDSCFDLNMQFMLTALRQISLDSRHSAILSDRLNSVHEMRRTVHNAMYLAEGAHGRVDDMAKVMAVTSDLGNPLFKTDGVGRAFRLYEDVLEREKARNEQWIPPEFMGSEWETGMSPVDREVRHLFKQALILGLVDGHRYQEEEIDKKESKEWPEWKINRALHLGRAFGSVSARFMVIFANTRLPAKEAGQPAMTSPFLENFVRVFNPIEHLQRKFKVGRSVYFLNYLFSGKPKIYEGKTEKEKLKAAYADFDKFTDIAEVMKKEDRDKVPNFIWNLTGITSRSTGWRTGAISRNVNKKEQIYCGLDVGLEHYVNEAEGEEKLRRRQEVFDLALRRTPLAILRGVVRGYPEIQKKINELAFGRTANVSDERLNKIDKIEEWLFLLKEDVIGKKTETLNFALVEPSLQQDVQKYAEAIRDVIWQEGLMGGRLGDLHDKNRIVREKGLMDEKGDYLKLFPFQLTASDLAYEKFDYRLPGQIAYFDRTWRDINGANKTAGVFPNFLDTLPQMTKIEDYKKAFKELYAGLNEFDHPSAQDFVAYMTKMLALSHQEKTVDRLIPRPLHWALDPFGIFERKRSLTQENYGSDAAQWAKIDIRRLIEDFATLDYISDDNKEELWKQLETGRKAVALEYFCRWFPLGVALALWFLTNELKKQLEEELKKS